MTSPAFVSDRCDTIVTMSGGSHTPRQAARGLPLIDRSAQPQSGAPAASEAVESAGDPKPCWIRWPLSNRHPGHVLAWQHSPTGGWQAVVIAVVDADHITPRQ